MPGPSTTAVIRPAVRLRPVPPLDPPFDDELPPEIWSAGAGIGQLALDLRAAVPRAGAGNAGPGGADGRGRRGIPQDPTTARTPATALAAVTTPAGPAGRGQASQNPGPPDAPARQTSVATAARQSSADPQARQAARRFLVICLEVINGYRPLPHLRPLVSPTDLENVLPQVAIGVERLAQARRAGKRPPAQLRVVRVCEPRPGAVEAAAVLGDATRTWALAFRLERRQGRWLSTAVRVL
jgi:Family of unknown function (DUF6459)